MKDCTKCVYAEWKTTKAGSMHPDGSGRCKFQWKLPPLPGSMYFVGGAPKPVGGWISRHQDLQDHCPYYLRADEYLPWSLFARIATEADSTDGTASGESGRSKS